jgi:hypothetical protein
MRTLLVALLFFLTPAAAAAQAPSALQQAGAWAQQLGVAQQPITDAYQTCAPTLREAQEALQAQSRERVAALLTGGAYRACFDQMRAAAVTARENVVRVGPMPAAMEHMLHIDSRDVLRRTVEAMEGLVGFTERVNEAMDALAAGDVALMQRKFHEARGLAGSMFDGQILLLETLRVSMPAQFNKSMMDIRLALSRGMRALIVADPLSDDGAASAGLRAEAARLRLAGQALRANWRRESVRMRALVRRIGDPGRASLLTLLDDAVEQIAAAGIRVGTSLETFPAGRLDSAAAFGAVRQLAETELLVLGVLQRFTAAASRLA